MKTFLLLALCLVVPALVAAGIQERYEFDDGLCFGTGKFATFGKRGFSIPGSLAVEARLKNVAGGVLLDLNSADFSSNVRLSLGSSGQVIVRVRSGATVATIDLSGNDTEFQVPADDEFHHLAVSLERQPNEQFNVYATLDGSTFGYDGLSRFPTSVVFTKNAIGAAFEGASLPLSNPFQGCLDELRIFSASLGSDAVDPDRQVSKNDRTLIALWSFDERRGQEARDASSKRNDASCGNGRSANAPSWGRWMSMPSQKCRIDRGSRVSTFDRASYRITSSGEFWLAQSATSQDVSIQAKAVIVPSRKQGGGTRPAVSAVAFKAGADVVVMNFFEGQVLVNNQEKCSAGLGGSGSRDSCEVFLPGSEVKVIVSAKACTRGRRNDFTFSAVFPGKFRLLANVRADSQQSNVRVRVPNSNSQSGMTNAGLCGNLDGDRSNDVSSTSAHIVDATDSFFGGDYQGPITIPDLSCDISKYPTTFQSLAQRACQICGAKAGDCLEDVCATGDIGAAQQCADEVYEACTQGQGGNCENEHCQENNYCSFQGSCNSGSGACTCDSGFAGATCAQRTGSFPCTSITAGGSGDVRAFESLSSAASFYSYGTGVARSSNTLLEVSNSVVLFLHEDLTSAGAGSGGALSFVVLAGRAHDSSSGALNVKVTVDSPTATSSVSLIDDASYPLDTVAQNGNEFVANLNWESADSDGFVVSTGHKSGESFCVKVQIQQRSGVNAVYVASRTSTGAESLTPVDGSAEISICSNSCTDQCGAFTNCGSCQAASGCGWCEDQESCTSGDAGGPNDGFCATWKFDAPSRRVDASLSYPVEFDSVSAVLDQSVPLDVSFRVTIASALVVPMDLLVSVDTSLPASSGLSSIQATSEAVTALRAQFPFVSVGLAEFSDIPVSPYGTNSDTAFRLVQDFTTLPSLLTSAASTINVRHGSDSSNSQLTALLVAAKSATWTSGRRHVLATVTWTDFHDTENDARLTNNNLDGTVDSNENYPSRASVRDALLAANIVPVFLVSDSNAAVVARYESLVATFGFGEVRTFNDASSNIFGSLQDALVSIANSAHAVVRQANGIVSSISPAGGYPMVQANTVVQFVASLTGSGSLNDVDLVVPGYGSIVVSRVSDNTDIPTVAQCAATVVQADQDVAISLPGGFALGDSGFVQLESVPSLCGRLILVGGDCSSAASLAVGDQISFANAQVQFCPAPTTVSTTCSFAYKYVSNKCGAESLSSSCGVTVTPVPTVNQVPTANSFVLSVQEDGSAPFTMSGVDADGSVVSARITTVVGGSVVSSPSCNGVSCPISTSVTFQPTGNLNGQNAASVTFVVVDNDGATSAPLTVSINVSPVDDAPVAYSQSGLSVGEHSSIRVALSYADVDTNAADNSPVTFEIVSPASVGTVQLVGNEIIYTAAEVGADSFQWLVKTGVSQTASNVATVSLMVFNQDDAPTASAAALNILEDSGPSSIALTATDEDAGEDPAHSVTIRVTNLPTHGLLSASGPFVSSVSPFSQTVSYTPHADYSGADSFTFEVVDNTGLTAVHTVDITVSAVNDLPSYPGAPFNTAGQVGSSLSLSVAASDVDSTGLGFFLCSSSADLTVTANGAPICVGAVCSALYNIQVSAGASVGTASFTFQARDETGGDCTTNTATAFVQISSLPNRAPSYVGSLDASVNEDSVTGVSIDLAQGVTDLDGDSLSYAASALSIPSGGSLTVVGNIATFIPGSNVDSDNSFTYTISDGAATVGPRSVFIDVIPQNDDPSVVSGSASTLEDTGISIDLSSLVSDIDSTSFTFFVGPSSAGALHAGANALATVISSPATPIVGSIVFFQPSRDAVGSSQFTFTASDGSANSNQATFTISITAVNDAPQANPTSAAQVVEGGSVVLLLAGTDLESGPTNQIRVTVLPTNGVLKDSNNANVVANALIGNSVTFVAGSVCDDSTTTFSFVVVDPADSAVVSSSATQSITILDGVANLISGSVSVNERQTGVSSCSAVPISVDSSTICGAGALIVEVTALGRGTDGNHRFFFDSQCANEITVLGELSNGATTVYYSPPENFASYSIGSSPVNVPGVFVTARAKKSASGAFGASGTTSLSVASTDNDESLIDVTAPNCQEDQVCTITVRVSDKDPEDVHSIEVVQTLHSGAEELKQNGNPVVVGQVFTVPASGLTFTYRGLPDACPSSLAVMQLRATDTPPASSNLLARVHLNSVPVFVSLSSVDDAPTASAIQKVFPYVGSASTIPSGASLMLSFPFTQKDLLCAPDQVSIVFPSLPNAAVGILKSNGTGSSVLVVANQPISCGSGNCLNQISFELTSAQPTNQVISTFDFVVRDNTVAQLSSSATVTIRTAARNVPILDSTHSHSFSYAEGSAGSVMVVKISQPESSRFTDMHLAVWSYPKVTVAASPNDVTHTSGVVFAASTDRIDNNGELYHPRDELLSPGAVEVPKVKYRPVVSCASLDVCEFHIAVRGCNATEAANSVAPCDADYAGSSAFTISIQPTSTGWSNGAGFEFQNQLTVTNDQSEAGPTFASFNPGLDSAGNEVCPTASGGPFDLYNPDFIDVALALETDLHYCVQSSPFRLFNLGLVNDEVPAQSWRLEVTVFETYPDGSGALLQTSSAATLANTSSGVVPSFANGVLSVSSPNLLTLRQAAYFGFNIEAALPAIVRVELFADGVATSGPLYIEAYQSMLAVTNAPTVAYPSGAVSFAITLILSAAVYSAYRGLKGKGVLPEDADPWDVADASDDLNDHPLFSGAPGIAGTAVYDNDDDDSEGSQQSS